MDDRLVQIKLPPRGDKCVVKGCEWHTDQVFFFGKICPECYAFITGRPGGEFSQAFRNAMGAASIVLRDKQPVASKILESYARGDLKYFKRSNENRTGDSQHAEGTETGRFDCSKPNVSGRPKRS